MVVDVGDGGRGEDQGDGGEEFEGDGAGEPVAVVGEVRGGEQDEGVGGGDEEGEGEEVGGVDEELEGERVVAGDGGGGGDVDVGGVGRGEGEGEGGGDGDGEGVQGVEDESGRRGRGMEGEGVQGGWGEEEEERVRGGVGEVAERRGREELLGEGEEGSRFDFELTPVDDTLNDAFESLLEDVECVFPIVTPIHFFSVCIPTSYFTFYTPPLHFLYPLLHHHQQLLLRDKHQPLLFPSLDPLPTCIRLLSPFQSPLPLQTFLPLFFLPIHLNHPALEHHIVLLLPQRQINHRPQFLPAQTNKYSSSKVQRIFIGEDYDVFQVRREVDWRVEVMEEGRTLQRVEQEVVGEIWVRESLLGEMEGKGERVRDSWSWSLSESGGRVMSEEREGIRSRRRRGRVNESGIEGMFEQVQILDQDYNKAGVKILS